MPHLYSMWVSRDLGGDADDSAWSWSNNTSDDRLGMLFDQAIQSCTLGSYGALTSLCCMRASRAIPWLAHVVAVANHELDQPGPSYKWYLVRAVAADALRACRENRNGSLHYSHWATP